MEPLFVKSIQLTSDLLNDLEPKGFIDYQGTCRGIKSFAKYPKHR